MKNKIIGFVLAMCLIVPMTSSAYFTDANTVEELQAQIASLLEQVEELKAKLANVQSNTTSKSCHTFGSDLKIGSRNSEVAHLLTALVKSGVAKERGSNFSEDYDEVVASYVTAFQEKYRDEILTPAGLNSGTGYLGARTRSMLNKLYGCGVKSDPIETPQPIYSTPFITGPSSNVNLATVGKYYIAHFRVDASDSAKGKPTDYTWKVSGLPSGLQANVNYCPPNNGCVAVHNPYLYTIYGTPTKTGKYPMMITAKSSDGIEAWYSFTLEIVDTSSSLNVTYPESSVSTNKPDIIVGSAFCSPSNPTASTMISCEVTVKNDSPIDVTKNFDVNIQGSAVTVQAPLKAWESRTVKSPEKFGLTILGWNLLTFPVDIWNNVDESNENNNYGYLKINVANNSTGAYEVGTGLCTSVSRTWGDTYVDIEGGSIVKNGIGYVVDGSVGVTAGANSTANMYAYVPDGFSKGQISVTSPNTVEDEYIRARGVLIAQVRSGSNPSDSNSQYGGKIQSINTYIAKCPSYTAQ